MKVHEQNSKGWRGCHSNDIIVFQKR